MFWKLTQQEDLPTLDLPHCGPDFYLGCTSTSLGSLGLLLLQGEVDVQPVDLAPEFILLDITIGSEGGGGPEQQGGGLQQCGHEGRRVEVAFGWVGTVVSVYPIACFPPSTSRYSSQNAICKGSALLSSQSSPLYR